MPSVDRAGSVGVKRPQLKRQLTVQICTRMLGTRCDVRRVAGDDAPWRPWCMLSWPYGSPQCHSRVTNAGCVGYMLDSRVMPNNDALRDAGLRLRQVRVPGIRSLVLRPRGSEFHTVRGSTCRQF